MIIEFATRFEVKYAELIRYCYIYIKRNADKTLIGDYICTPDFDIIKAINNFSSFSKRIKEPIQNLIINNVVDNIKGSIGNRLVF